MHLNVLHWFLNAVFQTVFVRCVFGFAFSSFFSKTLWDHWVHRRDCAVGLIFSARQLCGFCGKEHAQPEGNALTARSAVIEIAPFHRLPNLAVFTLTNFLKAYNHAMATVEEVESLRKRKVKWCFVVP